MAGLRIFLDFFSQPQKPASPRDSGPCPPQGALCAYLSDSDEHPTAEEVFLAVRRRHSANQPGNGVQGAGCPDRLTAGQEDRARRWPGPLRLPARCPLAHALPEDRLDPRPPRGFRFDFDRQAGSLRHRIRCKSRAFRWWTTGWNCRALNSHQD